MSTSSRQPLLRSTSLLLLSIPLRGIVLARVESSLIVIETMTKEIRSLDREIGKLAADSYPETEYLTFRFRKSHQKGESRADALAFDTGTR